MARNLFDTDTHINGTLTAKAFTPPAGCITDDSIQGGTGVAYTKVEHLYPIVYYSVAAPIVAATAYVHVARAAGTIVGVEVRPETKPSSGSYTVDVKKAANGSASYSTVLTGVVTVNTSSANGTLQVGTLSGTTFSDGDSFSIVVAASSPVDSAGLTVVLWLASEAA